MTEVEWAKGGVTENEGREVARGRSRTALQTKVGGPDLIYVCCGSMEGF